ncbi:MAG: hypothetical protein RMY28_009420 [Nostoc sp. ChiSLP01]|nr:hypothetical protein [Nostoc sp. CmiSLP01]MDZ8285226.1 hypothetical protein [Nostoc sp. ChiSLP01]
MPILGSKLKTSKVDGDVLDYKNRIIAASGSISANSLQAISNFVKTLKGNGLWNKCLEIAPYAGNNFADALIKLKYPSGIQSTLTNVGFTSADYSENTGLSADTSDTKNLRTGFAPSVHLSTSLDTHLSIYARNQAALTSNGNSPYAYLGSSGTSNGSNFLIQRSPTNVRSLIGSGTEMLVSTTTLNLPGLLIASTIGANLGYLFYNGTAISTDTAFTTNLLSDSDVGIFCTLQGTSTASRRSNLICGFHSIGYGLSPTDASIFYNAVQTLQTSLGRQV